MNLPEQPLTWFQTENGDWDRKRLAVIAGIVVLSLLALGGVIYLTTSTTVEGVTNEDTGENYESLESAIDDAESGDTLRLHEGDHGLAEEVVISSGPVNPSKELIIDKPLELIGDEGAVVQADLRIYSDNVTVDNVAFEEHRDLPKLVVEGSEVLLANSTFDGYRVDIDSPHHSDVEIRGSEFEDSPLTVVYTNSVTVHRNTFTGDQSPSQLVSVSSSDNTVIEENHIEGTGVPLQVKESSGVTVEQNNIISTDHETALYATQSLEATNNYWEGGVDTPIGWPSDDVDVDRSPVSEPYDYLDEGESE